MFCCNHGCSVPLQENKDNFNPFQHTCYVLTWQCHFKGCQPRQATGNHTCAYSEDELFKHNTEMVFNASADANLRRLKEEIRREKEKIQRLEEENRKKELRLFLRDGGESQKTKRSENGTSIFGRQGKVAPTAASSTSVLVQMLRYEY